MRYSIYEGVKRFKTKTIRILSVIGLGLTSIWMPLAFSGVVNAATNYFNGFEIDTSGWFANGAANITRVPTGTDGISSSDGVFHAEVEVGPDFNGEFTRFGSYENTFPANGYETLIDVYLNMSDNPTTGTDKRFDYSSAINQPDGSHRRDFIFSVGTNTAVADQFVMSASNNAPGWPGNPGRDPFTINETGWYTFRHAFQNDGGVLKVTMDVLDSDGTVLHSWTLSDASDVIGSTVGGHRYGWFVTSDFETLAIDNSELITVLDPPSEKDQCKKDGWITFNNPIFKNQGDCVSWVEHNVLLHGVPAQNR